MTAHECLSILSVVYCQVEVSASGWSLVRSSPTECGVSNGARLWMKGPWTHLGLLRHVEKTHEKQRQLTEYSTLLN